jgi:cytochrome c-type biogenesis protein CcmH
MKRLALLLLLTTPIPAMAQDAASDPLSYTQLPDPARERSAKTLMETLRCIVCQGQSIADSDAPMAGDMRALVRRRIADGEAPESVRAWLVARYGDYVTYDPPMSGATAPLWIAPLLLLAIGVLVARASFRRKRR